MTHSEKQPMMESVSQITQKLMAILVKQTDRKIFFSNLSQLLQSHFNYDRLCINLYDQRGEMLAYFTSADGKYISTISPIRPAEASSTVAGRVIATKKPIIITNFAESFPELVMHPIAEAGLTATIAFPLILNNEIIATLHCSFAKTPEQIYEITAFILELCPVIATCLGALLSLEQERYNEKHMLFQATNNLLPPDESIICHSKSMREVIKKVDTVAKLNIPILLLGETGTGKTLIAQTIHRRSPRNKERFVRVNCPSLASTLFESELFGHAKGAFTGAASKRTGRLELAHGGTIFFDEVAELAPEMQSKLLQVLDDSSFERVGESVPLAVDVRVVAATNVHIPEALAAKRLRADFYYRLSFCTIYLPPLRERKEDIPLLIASLAAQTAKRMELPSIKFTQELLYPMLNYHWPGNVRELRNVIGRLVVQNSVHEALQPKHITLVLEESQAALPAKPTEVSGLLPPPGKIASTKNIKVTADTLKEMERQHIILALERSGGLVAGPKGAAKALGMARSTLVNKIKRLGIIPEDFKPQNTYV